MYRYDNYTDSFVRIDGEPNTGSTTIRVGVPLKEMAIVKKVELTEECINKIADAVVRKLADRKTESSSEKLNNCEDLQDWKDRMWAEAVIEPQTEPLPKAINGVKIADAVEWADKWLEDNPVSEMWDMVRTLRDATEWQDEPQPDTEIAKAIVHKMIDDAVIAEDAYPDLRQKMHDAVDEYEPQTDCTNCDQVGRCERGRAVDCPLTERSE